MSKGQDIYHKHLFTLTAATAVGSNSAPTSLRGPWEIIEAGTLIEHSTKT